MLFFVVHYGQFSWKEWNNYNESVTSEYKTFYLNTLIRGLTDFFSISIVFIYILITVIKINENSKESINKTISNTKKEIELIKLQKELDELKK